MLAQKERARHPASSPSRRSRRGRDRCERSKSRPGLSAAGRRSRRGSGCRKSLHTPGSCGIRGRGRGGEKIFEQINNEGKALYLHHDQQGSTRLLTGSTGKTEATYTYDAYGNKAGSTGTSTTPMGYDGQYTNSDTGLIYLRAREYDPATAQFLSVDPKVEVTNAVYTYAQDNPLTAGDPTGELSEYKEIFGAQELVLDANRLRSLAADSALLAAAVADDYLSIPPAEYAKFLLQKAARFEAVANSLEHRKKNDAIGFLVREWYVTLPKTNIALPLKFKEAYAWYKGTNRSGEEQFWCGKEGWVYLR
jgi:RHS repeat-associated protein